MLLTDFYFGGIVAKFKLQYELKGKTVKIQAEEDFQKMLAHGHMCPYCNEELLTVKNSNIVYVIPNGIETQRMYGYKFLFCKANRKVCCESCAPTITTKALDWQFRNTHVQNVKNWLMKNPSGRVKRLPEKKGDSYRDFIMKMNGLDPKTMVEYVVYETSDNVGESIGTSFGMFLEIFSEESVASRKKELGIVDSIY